MDGMYLVALFIVFVGFFACLGVFIKFVVSKCINNEEK
jgi:hypothetical protein